MDEPRDIVVREIVPDVEEKRAARREYTADLAEGTHAVRKEHDAELADHEIETTVLEGELSGNPLEYGEAKRIRRLLPLVDLGRVTDGLPRGIA